MTNVAKTPAQQSPASDLFSSRTEKSAEKWERIMGGAAAAGVGGIILLLFALSWQNAFAAGPNDGKPGFEGGTKTFANPYAPAPGAAAGGDAFFDPAEDDDTLFPEDSYPTGEDDMMAGGDMGGGGSAAGATGGRAGGGRAGRGGSAGGMGGGIQVGGSLPGGVIPGNDSKPLAVDSETAEGCKEIITDFNYPDADIMDIAKTLGKLVGKNFILDKDVKGRITIISNSPITCGDAWKAFLTALDINGYALIPSGKYIRIARQRDARDKQLRTYTGDYSPNTDALITRLFPLKYLSADEVARNFRSFMPANSRIIPYDQTNTVIVTDTGSNIAKLAKLLEILDVEGYDTGIEVIPVKYASAVELSKLIDTLIPGTSAPGAAGGPPRFGGAAGGRFSARRTKEGGLINTIIADERTNTLIVHANTKGAGQVRELVNKLDQKLPATAGGGKVHVIYLQFADAEQISATLNNLGSSASSAPRAPTSPGGGTGVNPVQSTLFEGSIKVAPDKATNSLVITASPSDFATLQRVVNRLDIPRDQVYAEVVIMEINLGKDFTFSANVIAPQMGVMSLPNADLKNFLLDPASSKGALLSFKSGRSVEIGSGTSKISVSSVTGLVKALQTNANANVLATPQILTLDNTEATFESTEKIPIPTTVANGTTTSASVTKEPISLSITLKPQINKLSNFVKLDIQTKLEDVTNRELPKAVADLAQATVSRSAKTSVVVADGDTVVLGGLSRDKQGETTSKVPILGDIPLLGWLFKSRSSESAKTNLMIFITPKIIRQYAAVRAILDKKLKERDDFVEANAGGDDPSRYKRDEMIRGLPDLDHLLNNKPQTNFTIDKSGSEDGEGTLSPKEEPTGMNLTNPASPAAPTPDAAQAMAPPPTDGAAPPPPPTGIE